MRPHPPGSPLFPYTTLFRSGLASIWLLRRQHEPAAASTNAGHDGWAALAACVRSEEHTSDLQSHHDLVCRLLLEKKKKGSSMMVRMHIPPAPDCLLGPVPRP